MPLLSNDRNHESWPHVVSHDVQRHVHNLKSSVYVVSGQVKGKTLLPLPVGADKVEESATEVEKEWVCCINALWWAYSIWLHDKLNNLALVIAFCCCMHMHSFRPDSYDRALVHAIESVIIEWTHQIRDVLKKDSAQPLLEGLNPSPFVELEFWKAKAANLECIYDQVMNCNNYVDHIHVIPTWVATRLVHHAYIRLV